MTALMRQTAKRNFGMGVVVIVVVVVADRADDTRIAVVVLPLLRANKRGTKSIACVLFYGD